MESATIIILPTVRIERGDIDLGQQQLLPSSDRRKVVELWRVREQRVFEDLCADQKCKEAP